MKPTQIWSGSVVLILACLYWIWWTEDNINYC